MRTWWRLVWVVCVGAFASTASGTVIDLTPGAGSSGTIGGALFEFAAFQSTGTGVFDPFVRIQANGTEQGYNTSGRPVPFDEKSPMNFTHDLRLGDLSVISLEGADYYSFALDINESNNLAKSLLSLDEVQMYTSALGGQTTTDVASLGVLRFDLDAIEDSWVMMDHRNAEGSGKADMRMFVPTSLFAGAGADDFLYLYSAFGEHAASNAGFEEWNAVAGRSMPPVPEPATLVLLGLGLVPLARHRRRAGRSRS